MSFTFTITYNAALVRAAAFNMWWRRTGILYLGALVLLAASETTLLLSGDRSWWTGVLGTILLMGVAVPCAGLWMQWRFSLQRTRELEAGQAEIRLSEAGLRFSARSGAVEYPWNKLRFVARYPEYWLTGPSKNQLFILSLTGFPSEAQDFMLQEVAKQGGKVL